MIGFEVFELSEKDLQTTMLTTIKRGLTSLRSKYLPPQKSDKPVFIDAYDAEDYQMKSAKKHIDPLQKHDYRNFNPVIRSAVRQLDLLDEYNKDSDVMSESNGDGMQDGPKNKGLIESFNLIIQILVSRKNAFLIGQNVLMDRLAWLIINNKEWIVSSQENDRAAVSRMLDENVLILTLLSLANSIENELNFITGNDRLITLADIGLITDKVREYMLKQKELSDDSEQKHGLYYQFSLRVAWRLTNLYYALQLDRSKIGGPLMELRQELLPMVEKRRKIMAVHQKVIAHLMPKVRLVSPEDVELWSGFGVL